MTRLRTVCLLVLAFAETAIAQNPNAPIIGGASAIEMRRDMGMVPWTVSSTLQTGVKNAAKLNAVLAKRTGRRAVFDPEGLQFAIATETAGGSCVTIPGVWGGTLAGVGMDDRNPSAGESFVLGSTRLVNVSTARNTTALEYRGWGWSLGPMTIVGPGSDSVGLKVVHPGNQAKFGTVPVGKIEASLSFVNHGVGLQFADGANNTDESLWRFIRFRHCAVGAQFLEPQAVGHTFMHFTYLSPNIDGVAFDVQQAGNVVCHYGALLNGGTWLRTGKLQSNSRRLHFDFVKFDSTTGRQIVLEMQQAKPITLRLGGHIGKNSLRQNAGEPYVRVMGVEHDIELDVDGLPAVEAIAWARKPYPTVNQTIFATPDLGVDDDYVPNLTNVAAWFDTTDSDTVTLSTSGRIESLSGRFGLPNVLVEPMTDGGPLLTADGIHHRTAANWDNSTKYLWDQTPSSGCSGMENFEAHVVTMLENLSATNKVIASVNKTGQLCWVVYFTADHKVAVQFSTDGKTAAGTVTTDDAVGFQEPLLITVRRDGSTGESTLTVNGVKKSATIAAGSRLPASHAPLALGAQFNTSNGSINGLRGRLSALVVKDALSDVTELSNIRAHFRKKFGVR